MNRNVCNGSEAVFTDQAESRRAIRRPGADPLRVAPGVGSGLALAAAKSPEHPRVRGTGLEGAVPARGEEGKSRHRRRKDAERDEPHVAHHHFLRRL
jgi:hypothetical protein